MTGSYDTKEADYFRNLSPTKRSPALSAGRPRHPIDLLRAFNNACADACADEELPDEDRPDDHHRIRQHSYGGHGHGDGNNRVRMSDQVEIIKQRWVGSVPFRELIIDAEADGFIQRKHKSFELCRSNTFND